MKAADDRPRRMRRGAGRDPQRTCSAKDSTFSTPSRSMSGAPTASTSTWFSSGSKVSRRWSRSLTPPRLGLSVGPGEDHDTLFAAIRGRGAATLH